MVCYDLASRPHVRFCPILLYSPIYTYYSYIYIIIINQYNSRNMRTHADTCGHFTRSEHVLKKSSFGHLRTHADAYLAMNR